jgi:hypothetical protein
LPTQTCFFDPNTSVCACDPPDLACDLSPFPNCDGDCPQGYVCIPDAVGILTSCRCVPIPCDLTVPGTCDGPCDDPTQVCRFVDSLDMCRCEPVLLPCDQGPWPTCNGECPPDTICIPNPNGFCECVPIPCDQQIVDPLVGGTCDGDCPFDSVCAPVAVLAAYDL